MPTSRVNGIRLHWELAGQDGDPLVLVHGSWGDHQNWAPVVPELSRWFRVLAYDRRGHSRSEPPTGEGSVREDVADLAALMAELDVAPAHVVGSSFGASIVLKLATLRPELFRTMVVHEPPLFDLLKDVPAARQSLAAARERMAAVIALLEAGDWTGGARRFVETIAYGPDSWPALPDAVRDTFVRNAPTWLDETRDPDALGVDLDGLREFTKPALVTAGDQSPPFFPLVVERVAAALPAAKTSTYAGAGHVPHVTHPEEYVRVVREFIRRAGA